MDDRRTLALQLYRDGLRYTDIAARTGVPTTTLTNWFTAARRAKRIGLRRKPRAKTLSTWPAERLEHVHQLWERGEHVATIATTFALAQATVSNLARKHGWTPRPVGHQRPLTTSQQEWVVDKVRRGWRQTEIAKIARVTRERVRQIAAKRGVVALPYAGNIAATRCPHCTGALTRETLRLDYPTVAAP